MTHFPEKPRRRFKQTCDSADKFTPEAQFEGDFYYIVSGSFNATITVQLSADGGKTWFDVFTFDKNADTFKIIRNVSPEFKWRAGVKSSDYTSGTANVELVG